jgi:hypothetical protein
VGASEWRQRDTVRHRRSKAEVADRELGNSSQPIEREGRAIWIADAHRYGKRFVVRADEILTAFMELKSTILKNSIDPVFDGWQSRARAKAVRRRHPELHLTLFPQH